MFLSLGRPLHALIHAAVLHPYAKLTPFAEKSKHDAHCAEDCHRLGSARRAPMTQIRPDLCMCTTLWTCWRWTESSTLRVRFGTLHPCIFTSFHTILLRNNSITNPPHSKLLAPFPPLLLRKKSIPNPPPPQPPPPSPPPPPPFTPLRPQLHPGQP